MKSRGSDLAYTDQYTFGVVSPWSMMSIGTRLAAGMQCLLR
jgi:hypothetical protein